MLTTVNYLQEKIINVENVVHMTSN